MADKEGFESGARGEEINGGKWRGRGVKNYSETK
jgi:hypothetical protein